MVANEFHNGSFWFDSLGVPAEPEPPDALPNSVDVAIVGAGFTGLWTAYYLNQQTPDLDIAVFEANTVGFGASGRNGGWCLGASNGLDGMLEDPKLRDAGLAITRAMFDTVDEVGRICQAENIDAHFAKGGSLNVATVPFQVEALQQRVARMHGLGFDTDDYHWLDEHESQQRIGMTPNHGAMYFRHCASLHPARLVRGLAQVLRRRGVRIFERTPISAIEPGKVHAPDGPIRADRVVRATEGYTDSIKGQRRLMLPLYSIMVATEPLPDEVWNSIGLRERETFGDSRRVVIYGQRTLDGRLAFGGRAGYYFGSRKRRIIPRDDPMVAQVEQTLRSLFPILDGYRVTHGWGGFMGVPRHWRPSVNFDQATGMGWAGGYTGEGVAASNLAGRIMADLVAERRTDVTELAWVGDAPRKWEPEPLRYLGAKGIQWFGDRADHEEFATGKPAGFWGRMFDSFVG